MILLTDQNHATIAIIHNNILALPHGRVIGVLLGHCVFGAGGKVFAKYFKHTLYTLQGKVLAKEGGAAGKFEIDTGQLLDSAWLLIMKIKDHTCPVITPTEIWSDKTLREHFMMPAPLSVE
jgi:hypothetical protein